jgi:hypothetical protein
MKYLVVFAIAFACWACPAFAQHPGARMFPDSNFPGNDLYDVRSGSPEECADRCSADGRCRAFTFAIDQGRCYMKWGASGFTGSSSAVSGIIELHGGMPAQGTSDRYDPPPSYQPAAPPVVLGPPSRCSAKGNDTWVKCIRPTASRRCAGRAAVVPARTERAAPAHPHQCGGATRRCNESSSSKAASTT